MTAATALDRLVRPEVRLLGRSRPAYRVCGYVGLGLAVALAMALVWQQGLSPAVMLAVIAAAVATFLALAMATKLVAGEENLVYYHHEIAVVIAASALLWLLDEPVLAYLDPTILGVGLFLACGRVGCLMVGCCHGRPARRGVRYRAEHAAVGFPAYLVGVRLVPVQAVEALWALGIVLVGSGLVLAGQPPGSAFAWYVVAYDLGRFAFELVRGDPQRRYLLGFSEAQWIAVLLTALVVAGELAGVLPFAAWHLGALGGMAAAMLALTWRSRSGVDALLRPRHVEEIAAMLSPVAGPGIVRVGQTSLGVRVSAGRVESGGDRLAHYTLSTGDGSLTTATAAALAGLVVKLGHDARPYDLVPGGSGVFHVLIRAPPP